MGEVMAVLLAAGQSQRMRSGINKQYLGLGAKPVLYHSLSTLLSCREISEVVVVIAAGEEGMCRQEVLEPNGFESRVRIVSGGALRQDSVYRGLMAIPSGTELVVVHDGARPLVRIVDVLASLAAAREYGAAAVGVPVKDTVKVVDTKGMVVETPPREQLWSVQTPQSFIFELLMQAHRQALASGFIGTDDASLVERLGQPVKIVPGTYSNIKVTTPEDLVVARELLRVGEITSNS